MKYKRITVTTALSGGFKPEQCMEIEVIIEDNIYKVSERKGKLHIRVDGAINITPIANNCISINESK